MKLPIAIAATAMLYLAANASAMQCTAASGERRVALLELYTSEGCDSCPPADRWVSGLPARGLDLERLVVLGFHVDYWNYLGWPDPFAQKIFSERQRASTARNGARVVYENNLSNRITAGENRGKHLQHDFVVRELAGPFPAGAGKSSDFSHSFRLARNWKSKDIYVAAFVQHSRSGEVLQALALPHCG